MIQCVLSEIILNGFRTSISLLKEKNRAVFLMNRIVGDNRFNNLPFCTAVCDIANLTKTVAGLYLVNAKNYKPLLLPDHIPPLRKDPDYQLVPPGIILFLNRIDAFLKNPGNQRVFPAEIP